MTTIAVPAIIIYIYICTMAPAAHIIILTTIMDDANIDLLHMSNY